MDKIDIANITDKNIAIICMGINNLSSVLQELKEAFNKDKEETKQAIGKLVGEVNDLKLENTLLKKEDLDLKKKHTELKEEFTLSDSKKEETKKIIGKIEKIAWVSLVLSFLAFFISLGRLAFSLAEFVIKLV